MQQNLQIAWMIVDIISDVKFYVATAMMSIYRCLLGLGLPSRADTLACEPALLRIAVLVPEGKLSVSAGAAAGAEEEGMLDEVNIQVLL